MAGVLGLVVAPAEVGIAILTHRYFGCYRLDRFALGDYGHLGYRRHLVYLLGTWGSNWNRDRNVGGCCDEIGIKVSVAIDLSIAAIDNLITPVDYSYVTIKFMRLLETYWRKFTLG